MFGDLRWRKPVSISDWLEVERARLATDRAALDHQIALALRPALGPRERRDRSIIEDGELHLLELGVLVDHERLEDVISSLSHHGGHLRALLAVLNRLAEELEPHLSMQGMVLVGTEEMKARSRLARTSGLLNHITEEIKANRMS